MNASQAMFGRLESVLERLEAVATKLGFEILPKKGGNLENDADMLSLVQRLEIVADKIEKQLSSGGEGTHN